MKTPRLLSPVVATALGSGLVLATFAATSFTQPEDVTAVKGDRLMVATKVACDTNCAVIDAMVADAFETVATHDREAGVTVLSRVPRPTL